MSNVKVRGQIITVPMYSMQQHKIVLYEGKIWKIDEVLDSALLDSTKFPKLAASTWVMLTPYVKGDDPEPDFLGDADTEGDNMPIVDAVQVRELAVKYEWFPLVPEAEPEHQDPQTSEIREARLSTRDWHKALAQGYIDTDKTVVFRVHRVRSDFPRATREENPIITIAHMMGAAKGSFFRMEVINLIREFREEFCTTPALRELLGSTGKDTKVFSDWLVRNGVSIYQA